MLHPHSRLLRPVLLGAALAVLAGPPAFADGDIQMTPTVWGEGDTVTVTGGDLEGVYVRQKKLCVSPETDAEDLTCFGRYDREVGAWVNDDDPYIQRWGRTTLTFTVPPAIPVRGVLKLLRTNEEEKCFGSAGCVDLPATEEVILGSYSATPRIDAVLEASSGLPATSIVKGQRYEIEGVLFGAEKQTVSLGAVTAGKTGPTYTTWTPLSWLDIQSWGDQGIVFTAPETYDVSGGLKVNNSVVDSNVFALAAPVPAGSSSRSSAAGSVRSSSSDRPSPGTPLFSDVPPNHPYAGAIAWAKSAGVLQGYPDGAFRPDRVVNRAEFLKIVLAAQSADVGGAGVPSGFVDVDESAWYGPYVRYAKAHGVVQGYPDGSFRPDQAVNFAEGLKMAYATLGVATADTGGTWYDRYLRHAGGNGVLPPGDPRMDAGMSRKDVVWVVWKLTTHAGEWRQAATQAPASPAPSGGGDFGDGTFVVGTDVQPGTYRTRAASPGCYYERLAGFSGESAEIITNGLTDAPAIVTLDASDKGFKSTGCGTWTQDLSRITASQTSFGDGTFLVNTDVAAGTYRNSGGSGCYYERLSGFSGLIGDVIANGLSASPTIITLSPDDRGFESSGCGTWTLMK